MKPEKGESRQPFLFKDKYGSYEMPRELQQFCDQLKESNRLIDIYLTILAHVSIEQQAEYRNTQNIHYTIQLEGQSPVEAGNVLESVSKGYQGQEGMDRFLDARHKLIKSCGKNAVLQLESYLKVDSKGVETGDLRPLLGVDNKIVVPLSIMSAERVDTRKLNNKWKLSMNQKTPNGVFFIL